MGWLTTAVLITGCDSGFGLHLTRQLLQKGFTVIATFLTQENADNFASNYSGKGKLVALQLNVTRDEQVDRIKGAVEEACPDGLYAIVNNAGIAEGFLFEATTIQQDKLVFEVNVFGLLRVTRALIPSLRQFQQTHPNQFRPRIINVASVAGRLASTRLSAYSASKFAVEAYSDSIRQELAPFGILVSIIEPYFAKTNIIGDIANGETSFETKSLDSTAAHWETLDVRSLYPEDLLARHAAVYQHMTTHGTTADGTPLLEVSLVVNTMERAITSATPKSRYLLVPTLMGEVFIRMAGILPAWFGDWMVRKGDEAAGLLPLANLA
jgi:NAD(P)-dependent dehydrogenase (short-subunit alcohol dehydrogenase family)